MKFTKSDILNTSERFINLTNWRMINSDPEEEINEKKENFRKLILLNMDNLLELCEIGFDCDLYNKLLIQFHSLKEKALGFK